MTAEPSSTSSAAVMPAPRTVLGTQQGLSKQAWDAQVNAFLCPIVHGLLDCRPTLAPLTLEAPRYIYTCIFLLLAILINYSDQASCLEFSPVPEEKS